MQLPFLLLNKEENQLLTDLVDSYLNNNNTEILVDCSYRTMENQLSRASRLDLILRNHKNS